MTKYLFLTLIFYVSLLHKSYSQKDENTLIRNFFLEKYQKQNHEIFSGKITIINKSTLLFDKDKKISLLDNNKYLEILLVNGIFNPEVIFGNDIEQGDNIMNVSISNFKEIEIFTENPKIKRFKFLLYVEDEMNPLVCFIELTNEKAHKMTDIIDFLKHSNLTFFATAWVQI